MKKVLFIINPTAGKERMKRYLMSVLDLFTKADWDVTVHITQAALDATNVAQKQGADFDMIVCSGGDGTLSETISGMTRLYRPPVLGYIPAGTTNDFASSLQISSNTMKAAQTVIDGHPQPVDIGFFCEERTFVYVAAFGAFTEVSYMTPQEKKSDEMTLEGDFIFGMVTNTISVGGFKGLVASNVRLDDGLFEVLLIRTPKTPMELTNILSSMILKEEQSEYVYRFKTSRLTIHAEEPVDWVLDGEFGGAKTDVEIVNLQKRISIISGIKEIAADR